MSLEPEDIPLKLDKSLTRADVEDMLEQQGDSTKLNLSGLNLAVVNFADMDLRGAAFAYAHLNGAILLNANLEKTNLNSARLNGVKGRGVRLDAADLTNASLIEAKLEGASFAGASLNYTNLSGANLGKANLGKANLSGADLSEANLAEADLSGANLSAANLSRADLSDTNLGESDLRGAVLGGAKLDGADLTGANLSQVRLLLANLRKARLSQAVLDQADFSWSDLGEANLSGANLTGAKLIETDLTGADLRDSRLQDANLSGANLTGARLVGAALDDSTNLSGATLTGAYLSAEQKERLAAAGDVIGLEETRSAQDLAELEAALEAARLLAATPLHTANGQLHPADESGLGLPVPAQTEADLEATASLPALEASDPSPSASDPAAPQPGPPAFVDSPLSTVSLVVKETPLSAGALGGLLTGLDRLYTALGLIRAEKFVELVEFYRSPEGLADGALTLKAFDPGAGRLDLTAADRAAFPAFNAVLAGAGRLSEESAALALAENVLANFAPGLDPLLQDVAARPLAGFVRQLAAGPAFVLVSKPGSGFLNEAGPGEGPAGFEAETEE